MKEKKTNKIGTILSIIVCSILAILLLFNLSIIIQAKVNKDKVPSVFGYKPFIVLSGSMESEIHKGDLVVVKTIDPTKLQEEDIIAFRDQQETVTTHRIIDIVEVDGTKYFVTKGDNNDSQDQNLVSYEDVEGIYVFRIAGIGNLLNSLSSPTTIIIIIFGITIIFGISFYASDKKERDKEREEFLEYKKMLEEKKNAKK